MGECRCLTPPFSYADFDSRPVGTDTTNGRYGEVTIETCRHCGQHWLHYLIEYEAFARSGRWYRGLVSDEVARTVTPEGAVAVLESTTTRYAGGSFFESTGFRHVGAVRVDG
jgi:hypothetical protein